MPFQIKDFGSIVAAMVNHMRGTTQKITDFQPGSVARTLIEGPAVEVEELYLQMFLGLREAIPVATFLSFGFDLLPPRLARGFVSLSKTPAPDADFVVPAGTEFLTADSRVYISSEDVTWEAGANVIRVPVEATVMGLAGNAATGVITSSPSFGSEYTITNPAIETGRDNETDQEREARFAEFVRSLSRGTVAAVMYAAKSAVVLINDSSVYEYVTRIGIVETPGFVRLYLYSSKGLASDDLLADAQKRLDGWKDEATGVVTPGYRSAGVRVDAMRMIERAVSLTIKVSMLPGYTLNADVIQRLSDVFYTAITSVQPGEVLYLGTLAEILLSVPGVRSVVPQSTENITCGNNEALIPGVFNVLPL